MEAPFFIGQDIIAVRNSSFFRKGDEFKAESIKSCGCGCGRFTVHVGINIHGEFIDWGRSGKSYKNDSHFLTECFAPKISISDFTYEEAQEMFSEKQKSELVLTN